jgi:L-fuculose-phosphate aldolase
MTETERALRQSIIDTCLALDARGLNQGTSGNISLRVDPADPAAGFFLTPTSISYATMQPEDLAHVALDGTVTGRARPSSELPFHLAIMRARPDAAAIIHTHSTHATAVACLRSPIPCLHYLVTLFGGHDLRCADYATFGTDELSQNILRALAARRGTLLANHGLIVLGRDLAQALALTAEAEQLARLYLLALAAGDPVLLPPEELDRVLHKFTAYGYGPLPA